MGTAAYSRASSAISNSIKADYLSNGGQSRLNREMIMRAEAKISVLDDFTRDARALLADAMGADAGHPKGLLKRQIASAATSKQKQQTFQRMHNACLQSDTEWRESDIRNTLQHLGICRKRAAAWRDLIKHLANGMTLPFHVPAHL